MSVNQYSQILEEEFIMEQFRNEYADFPKGKLLKSESPDFILKETCKTAIGIEITKLHAPNMPKEKTQTPGKLNGYHSPEINRENIEYTIKAKDEKLHIYQLKKMSQLWLLITADLNESPISFNFNNKLKNWIFRSGFQKIFLFEVKTCKVFELNVST